MAELLSAFGIDWRLILVQSINFFIVLAGLTYFLYRPIMKVVRDREEVVAKGVEDAETASKAKEEIEGARETIIKQAHTEAGEVVSRAEEEGKRERAEIVKSAQERAESTLADARLQGEALKQQALSESEKEIARTAVLAAEKLIKEQLGARN